MKEGREEEEGRGGSSKKREYYQSSKCLAVSLFLSLFLSLFFSLLSFSNLIYSKHMCAALSLSASIRASGGPYDIV